MKWLNANKWKWWKQMQMHKCKNWFWQNVNWQNANKQTQKIQTQQNTKMTKCNVTKSKHDIRIVKNIHLQVHFSSSF